MATALEDGCLLKALVRFFEDPEDEVGISEYTPIAFDVLPLGSHS